MVKRIIDFGNKYFYVLMAVMIVFSLVNFTISGSEYLYPFTVISFITVVYLGIVFIMEKVNKLEVR